jgi:type I restriction enzyme S subunit
MNELPKGWTWKKLGEVCEINPKIPNKLTISDELEIQFLPMKLVEEETGKTNFSETRRYGDVKKGYTAFVDQDVIFAKVTPCMENGKIAVVENLKNGIGFGSSEFHVLRTANSMIPRYLFHFLVQKRTRSEAENSMTGAVGLRRVPKQFLENYPIPLPPLPIQRAIVTKIEEIFSELDHGVAQLKAAQQQLKVYRQAVLKWAFEGKLTGGDVVEGELPEGWKWVRLGEVGKVQLGRQRSPKNVSKDFPTKYIRAANITEGGLDLDDILEMEFNPKDFAQYKLEYGDLVLSEASGSASQVGKPAMWKNEIENCCFQNTVIRLRPKEIASSEYLLSLFKFHYLNGFFAKISGGVGINHLSAGKFSNIEIPLPPLPVQHLIVAEIERRLEGCAQLEAAIGRGLAQAEVLRQGVLKRAFEGGLVV